METTLTQYLMFKNGWDSVWVAHGPDFIRRRYWFRRMFRGEWVRNWFPSIFGSACFVGVWTGPQSDLLCLKPCATNAEANVWLSPEGLTVFTATVKACLKLRSLKGRI